MVRARTNFCRYIWRITNWKNILCNRIKDIENSCIETDSGELINCECNDAQRRIDNGDISCGEALCPDGCDICKFCLYYVVDCHSHAPSELPSGIPSTEVSNSSPSQLSHDPSQSPSEYPSFIPPKMDSMIPSSAPSTAPSTVFDLQNCESYENKW